MEKVIAELWHLISYENKYFDALDTRDKIIKHCENLCNELNKKENISKLSDALRIKAGLLEPSIEEKITFDEGKMILKFPDLHFKIDGHEIKTRINIAPCGGTRTNTRILSIPIYEGELEENAISSFFNSGKRLSDDICNVVGKHYYFIVGIVVSKTIYTHETFELKEFDKLEKYNLYIYIIGGDIEAFRMIVESADNREEMGKIISDSRIDTSLKILNRVIHGKGGELRWFEQESVSKDTQKIQKAIFGFSGNKSTGNFVGLTYGKPRYIARSLMQGVMADI